MPECSNHHGDELWINVDSHGINRTGCSTKRASTQWAETSSSSKAQSLTVSTCRISSVLCWICGKLNTRIFMPSLAGYRSTHLWLTEASQGLYRCNAIIEVFVQKQIVHLILHVVLPIFFSVMYSTNFRQRKISSKATVRQSRSGIYFRQTLDIALLLFGCLVVALLLIVYLHIHEYFWLYTCGFVKKLIRNLIYWK